MSTVGAALPKTREGASMARLGGLAGLGFALGLFIQNVVLLQGSPLPGADLDDVATFYADNAARVSIASGWVAINIPLLLIFAVTASKRLRQSEASELWGQLAFGGAIFLSAMFSIVTFLQAVLAARGDALATDQTALSVIWDLHNGAFALNTAALAILLGALAIGSFIQPLVPRWAAWMGVVAAVLLLAHSVMAVNVIEGGAAMFAGLVGFLMWVLWLIVASIRLLRTEAE